MTATRRAAAASATSAVGASTITRISGSVPLPRTRTRPWSPSSASTIAISSASGAARSTAGAGHPHVVQHLRQPRHGGVGQLTERSAGAPDGVEQLHRREQPVARGGQIGEDHVPTLLTAQAQVLVGQRLEHIAIAHRDLEDLDPVLLHPQPEAEVRHHGGDDRVLGQPAVVAPIDRHDRDDLVAVDQSAIGIDRQHAVGVTVEGEPGIGALAG